MTNNFSEGRATLEDKLTEDEMLHLWLSSMVKVRDVRDVRNWFGP